MDAKPLTLREAWRLHDRLYDDDRVRFVAEPPEVETRFREHTRHGTVSPKLWTEAWLLAFVRAAGERSSLLTKRSRRTAACACHLAKARERSSSI